MDSYKKLKVKVTTFASTKNVIETGDFRESMSNVCIHLHFEFYWTVCTNTYSNAHSFSARHKFMNSRLTILWHKKPIMLNICRIYRIAQGRRKYTISQSAGVKSVYKIENVAFDDSITETLLCCVAMPSSEKRMSDRNCCIPSICSWSYRLAFYVFSNDKI